MSNFRSPVIQYNFSSAGIYANVHCRLRRGYDYVNKEVDGIKILSNEIRLTDGQNHYV